jgi:excisionase family DNA binding protein
MEALLKATEVAELLGCSKSKAYELMASGDIPVVKIGTSVRVKQDDLANWIEENKG